MGGARKRTWLSGVNWDAMIGVTMLSSAPRALERLLGLPLLHAGHVVTRKSLRILARVALDPGKHQAVRLALPALLGLDQHFAGHGGAGFGIAIVVDHRCDVADGAAGGLGV